MTVVHLVVTRGMGGQGLLGTAYLYTCLYTCRSMVQRTWRLDTKIGHCLYTRRRILQKDEEWGPGGGEL